MGFVNHPRGSRATATQPPTWVAVNRSCALTVFASRRRRLRVCRAMRRVTQSRGNYLPYKVSPVAIGHPPLVSIDTFRRVLALFPSPDFPVVSVKDNPLYGASV